IAKSHTFIFIISPHSVNSEYCDKEITRALQYRKRIIPILHVEQIDRPLWQQRNPHGTDAGWMAYQEKGLHSSFPNMNPHIGAINWIYMREGQDDMGRSLSGLEQTLKYHQDYVQQHTEYLNAALSWTRHQRQIEALLLGDTLQTAEAWLKRRFQNEQPPCVPTSLHCEFITESIKNAHNMMTKVFLAYAQPDVEIMRLVRQSLQRQGFTVWSSQTDISTGEAFQLAVKRGIEEADNVIYLLSPDSLTSKYCQFELKYALTLKKRIIPILVRPVSLDDSNPALKALQYIDLTDNANTADYASDESELIKTLNQDAAYYAQHKGLLVKALKWKRQQQNPSVLLRGYDLRHAETWLKTAQRRSLHPATDIHREYIEASLAHPPLPSIDVFISYSSADADLARRLNDALQSQGKTTWFDQESIAAGTADFQQEIYRGIEASDNIVFILSPRSITSPYCTSEVEYAASLNKRFVTILHHPVNTQELHPQLAKVQWLDFSQQRDEFTTHFNQLVRTLDTDREHVRNHTKWLQQALEWTQKDHSDDVLLRGAECAIATQWLEDAQRHRKIPTVTDEQRAFITASHAALEAESRREKRRLVIFQSLLAAVSLLFLVAGGASLFAFRQNIRLSLDSEAETISRSLTIQPVEGLLDALSLVGKSQSRLQGIRDSVRSTLRDAIGFTVEQQRVDAHTDAVWAAVYSPDGAYIASGGFDRVIRLWDQDGTPIGEPFEGHTDVIWSVAFSPDGEAIASASSDSTVRLWDLQGNPIGQPLQGHSGHVKSVAFTPEGDRIVSGDDTGRVRLWDRQGNLLYPPFEADGESLIWSVAVSPDGNTIASAREDGLIHLWDLEGNLLTTLRGHEGMVISEAFSPDGQVIVSGGEDKLIRVWDRQGNLRHELEGHDDNVMSLAFSPDGQWLVSGSDDNTVRVWNRDWQSIDPPLMGHEYYVYSVAVSPDGQTILSGSEDSTLRLWNLPDVVSRNPTQAHEQAINALAMSTDGQTIVSASDDGTVRLWDRDGEAIAPPFTGHTDAVRAVTLTPDGQTIISGGDDNVLKVWNREGTELATLEGHEAAVHAIASHPTRPLVVSASQDSTIGVWKLEGTPMGQPIDGHDDAVNAIAFSPDGEIFVSGSADRTIRMWDLYGNLLEELPRRHSDDVNAIAFNSDGSMFVSASRDQTLRLWNRDGTPVGDAFTGHLSTVTAVAFSPNDEFIISASRDQTLRVWDLNGVPVGNPLTGHGATVNAVVTDPEGRWIISGGGNGILRRWEGGTLQEWIQWGCDRLSRHSVLQAERASTVRRLCP
ncbi:MAG: TIR domain-containing protein, partial [Leptolyngbyaceae bacterium]|nr:TIR domain-containing protein [Leptolyngbyaceae bacterium]